VTHLPFLEQVALLREGELDVALFHDVEEYADIEVEALFPGEPLAVLLPPNHRLAAKQTIGPDDLREELLVSVPRSANPPLHDRMLAVLDEAGYRFRGLRDAGGSNERDLMLGVADGLGVAIVPFSLTDVSEAGAIVIRRALEPALTMPDTVVAWRKDLPRHLEAGLATVRAVARELREREAGGESA